MAADDPLESLSHEEKERLAQLVQDNPTVSRRDLMQAGGALGVGALLGGAGGYVATQNASAGASTSDSDGNVGTQSDRVDVFADGTDTRSLVIGGTLYEEDGNSPINVSGVSSHTYTLADSADEVIIMPQREAVNNFNIDQLRVNADSGTNYDIIDNSDSQTTGQSEWGVQLHVHQHLSLSGVAGDRINLSGKLSSAANNQTIGGRNLNVSAPITQFTLLASSGSDDIKARVYRRVMNI